MKFLAVILFLLGVGNLVGSLQDGARSWNVMLNIAIGVSLIAMAAGIVKQKMFAWPLGFAAIGFGAVSFILTILSFAEGIAGTERAVLLSFCTFGALLVAGFWSRVWHRQRGYFSRRE